MANHEINGCNGLFDIHPVVLIHDRLPQNNPFRHWTDLALRGGSLVELPKEENRVILDVCLLSVMPAVLSQKRLGRKSQQCCEARDRPGNLKCLGRTAVNPNCHLHCLHWFLDLVRVVVSVMPIAPGRFDISSVSPSTAFSVLIDCQVDKSVPRSEQISGKLAIN